MISGQKFFENIKNPRLFGRKFLENIKTKKNQLLLARRLQITILTGIILLTGKIHDFPNKKFLGSKFLKINEN